MDEDGKFPTAPSPAPEMKSPWQELLPDLLSLILEKLGAEEILTNAEYVCKSWRRLCFEPSMWRVIDIANDPADYFEMNYKEFICRIAVDRSQGQLIDISIENFGREYLLNYIADRSPQLKRLRLVCSYNYNISAKQLSKAVKKFPLLEELHLYYLSITKETIETIGRSCPMLKSFKLNSRVGKFPYIEFDGEAVAIAENMPKLRHLQLFGNKMTNEGLKAILNGCTHLESLDLRLCFNLQFGGDLGTRCSQQIKDLRYPHDPTDDYEFAHTMYDSESPDENLNNSDADDYQFSDESN